MPGRSGAGGGRSTGGGGGRSGGGGGGTNSSGGRTYVDNSYNRSVGRVGMAVGTAVISRSPASSSSSGSTPRTYVDNSFNRSHDRVGKVVGTAVISQNAPSSSATSEPNTYVDNSFNRRHDRVGKEKGTAVISTSKSKTYVDNPLNRRLGRVGKPIGEHVHSLSDPGLTTPKGYIDNDFNRKHGRVGKPLGSCPIPSKSRTTRKAKKIFDGYADDPGSDIDLDLNIDDDEQEWALDVALCNAGRDEVVTKWQKDNGTLAQPHTHERLINDYRGTKIEFSEIKLEEKIGSGGFGDVYFAKWKDSPVAAKKLRVEKVSAKRLKEFTDELFLFCELDHENIVKLIGACVNIPNLCIVMEYMQMSLFDALHIRNDIEFTETQKLKIIKQSANGLQYLHDKAIAHCDIKSQNILLNCSPVDQMVAKITDFGLSMMKNETETSTSAARDVVRNMGTPRYSSPENLRGELLNIPGLKMSDMYSFSLVMYEIAYEAEPFHKLNLQQLMKQVGEKGLLPEIPSEIQLNPIVFDMMERCWNREPGTRPNVKNVCDTVGEIVCLYK